MNKAPTRMATPNTVPNVQNLMQIDINRNSMYPSNPIIRRNSPFLTAITCLILYTHELHEMSQMLVIYM